VESLEVDGSLGEGGGQILRTAVAFSAIQKRPIRVVRIRSGRREPGLKKQHAAALRIMGEIFDAQLQGAEEGSQEITFSPGLPRAKTLSVDMKTAASITLVLQAVIPAVALSRSGLSLELFGGTDVPWSPTFDYLVEVARKAYELIGITFSASSQKRGYYPNGGGKAVATIEPCDDLKQLEMVTTNIPLGANVISRCGRLPRHVADRQLESACSLLKERSIEIESAVAYVEDADSPGSSVLVYAKTQDRVFGSDAIGARGKPAEAVGKGAAEAFIGGAATGACVDVNLVDMIAPLLSLGRGVSRLTVPEITSHLKTSMQLARQFTGCEYSFDERGPVSLVTISPK